MGIKAEFKNNPDIIKVLGDAWLNIDVDEKKIFNPLENIPSDYEDTPEVYITWLLSRPEYFSFICSEILNVNLIPTQALMLRELWERKFPMLIASRGFGKSYMLALHALLRMLLLPGRKIVIAGAAFRQSKVIFEYMETIWNNAPLLRDIVGTSGVTGPRRDIDMCKFHIGESKTIAIPIGDGSKIRGQRAHDLITDEFDAIPRQIFEVVLVGFTAVTSTPIQNVKMKAAEKMAKEMGIWIEEDDDEQFFSKSNQLVLSGTAGYDFNHFGEYWKRWCSIIRSKGDLNKIKDIIQVDSEEGDFLAKHLNWKDFSVIRIPFELIPEGFMDDASIARSRATMHSGLYQMEYGAVFSKDSNGFYKRTLIESCVVSNANEIYFPSSTDAIMFSALIRGNPTKQHVFGVDPASERDNFCINIIELNPEHRRVVYCWTVNRQQHKDLIKAGMVKETDYYSFCAIKIRELMKRFPCERIALDSQGGGIAIMEALHDADKISDGELPIWPIIDDKKEKDTDTMAGLHIVELINFASADWTVEANHGLRKDLEDKALLFPYFDAVALANAVGEDELKRANNQSLDTPLKYDTLEDCMMEIEEMKNELSTIVMSKTPNGRDKWDTPEIKLPGNRKERMKKDRYSSLLMANMVARQLLRNPAFNPELAIGGFAGKSGREDGPLFVGNQWYNDAMKEVMDQFGGV